MKYILIFFILLIGKISFAQAEFPNFLQGTWKMENKELYEHWDKLNDNSLKGFSYEKKNGQMNISEYLEIERIKNEIIYTASVLNQNNGIGIHFKMSQSDSLLTFENPNHDFPNKIVYQRINNEELLVHVSSSKQKGFSYKMKKINEENFEKDTTVLNPNYDPLLAQKLGADEYGMKSFILVILKTGSNQTSDKTFINNCFKGHLENINRLVKEEKMVVAGPLGKNDKTYRGIFILNVTTVEDAEKLLQTDPAIKEGLLSSELYKWFGSAALPEYLESSDKIWKVKP